MNLQNIKYVILFNKGFTLTDNVKAGQLSDIELKQQFGACAEEVYSAKVEPIWEDDVQVAVKVNFGSQEVFGIVKSCWDGDLFAPDVLSEKEVEERKTFFAGSAQEEHLVKHRVV